MNVEDLCKKLQESGTPEGPLAVIVEIQRGRPTLGMDDLLIEMSRDSRIQPGTIVKAKKFVDEARKPEPQKQGQQQQQQQPKK